ncbi:MAG TPA: phospholipase D-like domain-containing protein [Candidatus Nanoarchaeia archaeon]|nr:phospholipase D-like domain-containing protein [Candidatus Nanoarchaeia archaeon]
MRGFRLFMALCLCAAAYGCAGQQEQQAYRAYREESFNYTVHFCSEENCMQLLAAQLAAASESANCALYRISDDLLDSLQQRSGIAIRLVVDSKAVIDAKNIESGMVQKHNGAGTMHNKYCIIDNRTIVTGSFNPTVAAKNDYNNLLVINSTTLAAFYQEDFYGLQQNHRRKAGNAVNIALLNNTVTEVHFCPAGNCAAALIRELRQARQSITFAAYSFTSPEIANELIIRASQGINVSGVVEKSTTGSKYSKHNVLAANGVSIAIESSKKLMHHKFFVIDGSEIITGSFNPTENANTRNAENLIIIKNREIAEKYTEEFNRIYNSRDSRFTN